MPTAFNYAARSDTGMVRSDNQDSGYAGPHLLVVADGMGGHAGGDLASAAVIAELFELDDDAYSGGETAKLLADRIARANAELGRLISDDNKLDGMGTTVTAILRSRNTLALAHIGDSRGYLFRDNELTQITQDHSSSGAHRRGSDHRGGGGHPPTPVVRHPGAHRTGDDPMSSSARPGGDRYLLCSDGLTGFVTLDTIRDVLADRQSRSRPTDSSSSVSGWCSDNVTVVIADVVDVTSTSPPTQPQIVGAAAVRRRKGTAPSITRPEAAAC